MRITEIPGLRNEWVPIALAHAPTPRLVRIFAEDYVLWRAGETPVLSEPYCPHRGARLDAAREEACELVCPYHGWAFSADGRAVRIPQLEPGLPIPPKARVATWPVVERYGMLWACVGTPATDGPPVFAEAEEGWRVHVDFFELWEVSALRIIDNNLDQSHPAFVHQGTFGDPNRPLVPRYEIERTPRGFRTRIPQDVGGVGPQMGIDDEAARFTRFQEAELLGPLHTRIRLSYGGTAPDYAFYGSALPIDDGHSMYLRISALAGDEAMQPYELFHAYSRRVVDEDRIVLETTNPDMPLEPTGEVHLRCDRNTLEYRRILSRLVPPDAAERRIG